MPSNLGLDKTNEDDASAWRLLGLPSPLKNRVIARVIQAEESTAMPLLLTCRSISRSACRSLYEEIYVIDDEAAVLKPPMQTRLASVLAHPNRYAQYVRTLVIVPKPIAEQALRKGLLLEAFDEDRSVCLGPKQLGELLSILGGLRTLIWASDRSPPPQLGDLVCHLCNHLKTLVVRPVASHALCASNLRWDGKGLVDAHTLKRVSVSHLSTDGIRQLTCAVKQMNNLTHLTIDSQFADDAFLSSAGAARSLSHLVVRCSGTKMTDRGVYALFESSSSIQSLEFKEVEGRLSKGVWSSLGPLPSSFLHFRLVYSEEGPHHSWITDHLDDTFALLELSNGVMRSFSITTIHPEPVYSFSNNAHDASKLTNGIMQVKRTVQGVCDDTILPRNLPAVALKRIALYGQNLEELELDMYACSIQEVRAILESCRRLRHLRIFLDAPLSKLFGLSSNFAGLTRLNTLSISVTERFCPTPGFIHVAHDVDRVSTRSTSTAGTTLTPDPQTPETISVMVMPELSPASTQGSHFSDHEALSPISSPAVSLRNSGKVVKNAGGLVCAFQLVNGSPEPQIDYLGCTNALITRERAPELSIPPKREIRKVVRRCPTLRTIKWIGRLGKGEWRITPATPYHQTTISFVPVYLLGDDSQGKAELSTGADVEALIVASRLANTVTTPSGDSDHDEETIVYIPRDVEKEARCKLSSLPPLLLDDANYPTIHTSRSSIADSVGSVRSPVKLVYPSLHSRSASSSTASTRPVYVSRASIWHDTPISPKTVKQVVSPPIWPTTTRHPYVCPESAELGRKSETVPASPLDKGVVAGTTELNRQSTSTLPNKPSVCVSPLFTSLDGSSAGVQPVPSNFDRSGKLTRRASESIAGNRSSSARKAR